MFRLYFVAHENGAIHKPCVSVVGMLSLKVSPQSAAAALSAVEAA